MQNFTLQSSKIAVSKICCFDIFTTHNNHPRYVKHVLNCIHVFFTLFGYWVLGGGVSQGIGTLTTSLPAYANFHPVELKNRSIRNLFF